MTLNLIHILFVGLCRWFGVPVGFLAQESAGVESNGGDYEVSFTSADLPWLIGFVVVFLLIVGGAIYWFWRNASSEAQSWSHADSAFERAVLRQAPAAAMPLAEPVERVEHTAPWQPPAASTAPPSSAPFDDLVNRLQQLGLIDNREGTLAMPIPPDALVYRLRSGGQALLLPRVESEAFLAYQSGRFERIFAMTPSGEVLSISKVK